MFDIIILYSVSFGASFVLNSKGHELLDSTDYELLYFL